MFGISSASKEAIGKIVEDIFDRIALQFIGDIPKLKYKKLLVIGHEKNLGLANLFIQSMNNKTPNPIEADTLKSLLESSHGYLEALKARTRANLAESIDGAVKEAQANKSKLSEDIIKDLIAEEMAKAGSHLKTVAESEGTKLRNVGALMDISRVSASLGESDPNVFFVVTKDNTTCKHCLQLHLMPDQITPRVWKLSELKHGYFKRGEDKPSVCGLHPNCRCSLTFLSKGFGFDTGGRVKYISANYDIFTDQRKTI